MTRKTCVAVPNVLRVTMTVAACLCGASHFVQPITAQPARPSPQQNFDSVEVHVVPVQGKVYMLVGAGGNMTLQIGDDGVLVVDAQFAQMSEKILAAIRKLTDKPVYWIINTHVHPDHTGGNEALARAGTSIQQNAVGSGRAFPGSLPVNAATIVAHEKVLGRMSAPTGVQSPRPQRAWPTATYFGEKDEMYFNGEPIDVIHVPRAHTDGDSIVFFRQSDVVAAGDIFVTTMYPTIDMLTGGTINGIIDALNRVIDVTVPKNNQEDGTLVIPGHGRLSDEADVVEFRDMATIVRDRIQSLIKKGMTLEQVKAAKPTLDYDARYGAATGSWTTEMFIEAVYRTLAPPAQSVGQR